MSSQVKCKANVKDGPRVGESLISREPMRELVREGKGYRIIQPQLSEQSKPDCPAQERPSSQ